MSLTAVFVLQNEQDWRHRELERLLIFVSYVPIACKSEKRCSIFFFFSWLLSVPWGRGGDSPSMGKPVRDSLAESGARRLIWTVIVAKGKCGWANEALWKLSVLSAFQHKLFFADVLAKLHLQHQWYNNAVLGLIFQEWTLTLQQKQSPKLFLFLPTYTPCLVGVGI